MSKSNNTTALAMPVVQAVTPKPTKTEIVNAMVVRAKVAHDAENEKRSVTRKDIEEKIHALSIKLIKQKNFDGDPDIEIVDWTNNPCVKLEYKVSSPALQAMILQMRSVKHLRWEESMTRQSIKNAIDNRSPNRLLDNPETVKAMDAMLEQWGI